MSTSKSNMFDTRTLVACALFAAIGVALSFLEFPFGIAWLKYDASNVPALVGGFVFGPLAGVVIGGITCVAHAILNGDWLGCLMNFAAVASAVLPAALLYKYKRSLSFGIAGLVIGIILATGVMIVMNLIFDPGLYGMTYEEVAAMVLPIFLPFNAMKAAINAVVTVLIYKPIANIVRPRKGNAVVELED